MATRSTIAMLLSDNTVTQIYCHWDGNIQWNGKKLKTFYTTPQEVKELISHGGLSSLGDKIHPTIATHSFNYPQEGCCVFYHRDRGDSLNICKYPSFEMYLNKATFEQFNYVYVEDKMDWFILVDGELLEFSIANDND